MSLRYMLKVKGVFSQDQFREGLSRFHKKRCLNNLCQNNGMISRKNNQESQVRLSEVQSLQGLLVKQFKN